VNITFIIVIQLSHIVVNFSLLSWASSQASYRAGVRWYSFVTLARTRSNRTHHAFWTVRTGIRISLHGPPIVQRPTSQTSPEPLVRVSEIRSCRMRGPAVPALVHKRHRFPPPDTVGKYNVGRARTDWLTRNEWLASMPPTLRGRSRVSDLGEASPALHLFRFYQNPPVILGGCPSLFEAPLAWLTEWYPHSMATPL